MDQQVTRPTLGSRARGLLERIDDHARALWRGEWMLRRRQRRPRVRAFEPVLRARGLYIALFVLVLLGVYASIFHGDIRLMEEYGPNLATDALGILITLAFVQRFLERQERARRLRGSMGGMRRARQALGELATAWGTLIRDSLPRLPSPLPATLDEVFAPDLTEAVRPGEPAFAAAERAIASQARLRDVIATYGATLDPIYLEALDRLADDPFPPFVAALAAPTPAGERDARVRLAAARGLRNTHFALLTYVVELHNAFAKEAAALRGGQTAPRSETFGFALDSDADLRVTWQISPAFWRVPAR
jgi:hypothetical protein